MSKPKPMIRRGIEMDPALYEHVGRWAQRLGLSLNATMAKMLRDWIDAADKEAAAKEEETRR